MVTLLAVNYWEERDGDDYIIPSTMDDEMLWAWRPGPGYVVDPKVGIEAWLLQ